MKTLARNVVTARGRRRVAASEEAGMHRVREAERGTDCRAVKASDRTAEFLYDNTVFVVSRFAIKLACPRGSGAAVTRTCPGGVVVNTINTFTCRTRMG